MKIRKIKKSDFENVVNLFIEADERSREWAENKARDLLLAEEDEALIGFVCIKKDAEIPENMKKKGEKFSHLAWIAVSKKHRYKGVGSKLLKASERYAKKFLSNSIELGCAKTKIPFYEKNGYEIRGHYIKKKLREYVMIKKLF
jgi:ribosomal protein S18 acetylase RimI-like enzyme